VAIPSVADLAFLLRELGLLSAAGQEEFDRDLRHRFEEPQGLAAELVRRGRLTSYQVERLLEGHGRELAFGPYILLEPVGEGGMGRVFKARHRLMNRVVALKLLRAEYVADPDAVPRFRREVQAAAQLSHRHIVAAYDAAEINGVHFLSMEYAEGTDLARLIKARRRLPIREACDYARQAALGLQHAFERGLVHRDVKPSNLLLTAPHAGGMVKLLDLGVARLAEGQSDGDVTRDGALVGTPDYIAPEQAEDPRTADTRSDLYSLGCTLYHFLAGCPPFPVGTLMQKLLQHRHSEAVPVERLRPEVPPELAAVVRRLMAKRPADRYQTPAEAAQALAPFAGEEPKIPTPYTAEISRANPSCFLFLIDQSGSMGEPFAGQPDTRKAHEVAAAVNRLLRTLALRCAKGHEILDRFHVGVIGYGGERAAPALGGALAGSILVPVSKLAASPLRLEQRTKKVPDGAGGLVEETVRFPVWFEPAAKGKTPMCAALDLAWSSLAEFVSRYPGCYPPIVINITDGKATDGTPEAHAQRVRDLASRDGNVLLFNVHLSARSETPIELPDEEAVLPDDDAKLLFRMSSPLPPQMRETAHREGYRVSEATRGFVFNGDMVAVIRFLDIGTRIDARNMK
jgi:serine/threonine protein kinase